MKVVRSPVWQKNIENKGSFQLKYYLFLTLPLFLVLLLAMTMTGVVFASGYGYGQKYGHGKHNCGYHKKGIVYVKADARKRGNGSYSRPYNNLKDVEKCSRRGDTIKVLASYKVLGGGIELKKNQKLIGVGRIHCKNKRHSGVVCKPWKQKSKIRNLKGDAITLANNNLIKGIHITEAYGNGIFGKNVRGTKILHNLIRNTNTSEGTFTCEVALGDDDLSDQDKTGCGFLGSFGDVNEPRPNFPLAKAAVAIQNADTHSYRKNKIVFKHNIIKKITGNGFLLAMQGHEKAVVKASKNVIKATLADAPPATSGGFYIQLYDFAVADVHAHRMTLDNLRDREWFRFFMHILGEEDVGATLNVKISRSESLNSEEYETTNRSDGIELLGSAPDFTLNIHVENSTFVGVPNLGVFLLFGDFFGFPFIDGDMLIDFGCFNPDTNAAGPDRKACKAMGLISRGGNRIFGNSLGKPVVIDVNANGDFKAYMQHNWWGQASGAANNVADNGAVIDASFPLPADPK